MTDMQPIKTPIPINALAEYKGFSNARYEPNVKGIEIISNIKQRKADRNLFILVFI